MCNIKMKFFTSKLLPMFLYEKNVPLLVFAVKEILVLMIRFAWYHLHGHEQHHEQYHEHL